MTLQRDGLPVQVMKHLAENGPTARDDLNGFMRTVGNERAGYMAMMRLKEAGFIKHAVWLTPRGLAELQRLGLAPTFEGAAPAAAELEG